MSSNIVRTLLERDWVCVVGHRDVPGRPEMFGTTKAFLDYFGLKKLDDLPPLADLSDWESLRVQLNLPEVEDDARPGEPSVTDLPVLYPEVAVDNDHRATKSPASDDTADSRADGAEANSELSTLQSEQEPESIVAERDPTEWRDPAKSGS